MRKIGLLHMAFVAAICVAPVLARAEAKYIHGDQFISVMDGNTLSGKSSNGAAFNIYFLPGGEVTYTDSQGASDHGAWHLDDEGDVCVSWQNPADAQEGCFRVTADGQKVHWQGKSGSNRGVLRGGVTETFLHKAP